MLHEGYQRLILNILLQTKLDLQKRVNPNGRYFINRRDAYTFIHTDWFETLCMAINLEPSLVRDRLFEEMKVYAKGQKRVYLPC